MEQVSVNSRLIPFMEKLYLTHHLPLNTPFGEGGLYGVGKYGFSISQSTANVDFGGSQASFKDIDFNTEVSASVSCSQVI